MYQVYLKCTLLCAVLCCAVLCMYFSTSPYLLIVQAVVPIYDTVLTVQQYHSYSILHFPHFSFFCFFEVLEFSIFHFLLWYEVGRYGSATVRAMTTKCCSNYANLQHCIGNMWYTWPDTYFKVVFIVSFSFFFIISTWYVPV